MCRYADSRSPLSNSSPAGSKLETPSKSLHQSIYSPPSFNHDILLDSTPTRQLDDAKGDSNNVHDLVSSKEDRRGINKPRAAKRIMFEDLSNFQVNCTPSVTFQLAADSIIEYDSLLLQ